MIFDLGGFFEESDGVCSTFGLIPKSPSCRLVSRVCSFIPLRGDTTTASMFFDLHMEIALIRASMVPSKTKPTIVSIALANISERKSPDIQKKNIKICQAG